jgi:ribonuclease PH
LSAPTTRLPTENKRIIVVIARPWCVMKDPMRSTLRPDGRAVDALRDIEFELNVQHQSAGSVLVRWGNTHVLCSASIDDKVPTYRPNGGWVTAEYAMLPGSGDRRIRRERNKVGGRTAEIQRLIGRSLRAAVDLSTMPPITLWLDCDVINADGGTRCASITGATIAAAIALHSRGASLTRLVAAASIGVREGHVITDLNYAEDSTCDVDLNFVASPDGIIEVQGTAEGQPFSHDHLLRMVAFGEQATKTLFEKQRAVLAQVGITL